LYKNPTLTTDNTDDTDLHGSKSSRRTIVKFVIRVIRGEILLFVAKPSIWQLAKPVYREELNGKKSYFKFLATLCVGCGSFWYLPSEPGVSA
jgi:hypothetical protein